MHHPRTPSQRAKTSNTIRNQRNVMKAIALSPAKLDVQRHLVARDCISINISRHRVQPCGRGRFSKRRLSAGRRRFYQVLLLGARETGGASGNDEYCVWLNLNLRLRQIQEPKPTFKPKPKPKSKLRQNLSLSLSLSLGLNLSLSLSSSLTLSLSLSPSLGQSLSLSLGLNLNLCLNLSLCLNLRLYA